MLVSAIMPVYNRREFIPLAIGSYLAQDWLEKELVVVDDSPEETRSLFGDVPGMRYLRLPERLTVGAKRNIACRAAHGEIIAHFDSDDWSAPCRITDQAMRLMRSEKAVTGYHSMLFWNETRQEASRYIGEAHYFCGTSMCYRKEYWEAHPFADVNVGEDTRFWRHTSISDSVTVDGGQMMVARIHNDNTSPKIENAWPLISRAEIPAAFFEALR